MPADHSDDPTEGQRPRRMWPPEHPGRRAHPTEAPEDEVTPARARAEDVPAPPEPVEPPVADEPAPEQPPVADEPASEQPADEQLPAEQPPADDAEQTAVRPLTPFAVPPYQDQPTPVAVPPARPGFGRTAAFTVLGAIVPGAGLLAAGRRRTGAVVLSVFVVGLLALIAWAVFARESMLAAAVNPTDLHRITVVLLVIAVLWVAVLVASHLALRGKRPPRVQRVLGGLLVGVLAFAVAAPMAVAARYSYVQAATVNTIFKSDQDSNSATRPTMAPTTKGQTDPWANTPRLNVLLLGGDADSDRTGTRTDTVIVASIDTKTGDTVLISLPRNTARMPFPKDSALHRYYPNGFTNGDGDNAEFFLNAMYDNVPATAGKDVLGKTDNVGADVMKLSVGEATGLKIDYYVLIDFDGFKQLVNALGGITVNINNYVAVGGRTDLHQPPERWLKPGADQHLNGNDALWFARGRYGATTGDFERMDRQRCVINAIIDQANPTNLLTRYEKIAAAGKKVVQTDLPREVLPMMVDLGTRVQGGNVRSVVFKNGVNGFSSPRPDFTQMRQRVKASLGEAKAEPSSSKPSKSPSGDPTTQTGNSESAADACAFQPSVAATAQIPSY